MRLLLDTHTFIWWDSDPSRIPQPVIDVCQNRANTLILSVVSVWEMQIKSQLGKLKLNLPLSTIIEGQREANNIEVLPIQLKHVLALDELPAHHHDPFDRLLIAQSCIENAVLVSADSVFTHYPVDIFW